MSQHDQWEDLENARVSIGKGKGNIQEVKGEYVASRKIETKFGEAFLHCIALDEPQGQNTHYDVYGCAALDKQLVGLKSGTPVWIVYQGEVEVEGGMMKDIKVRLPKGYKAKMSAEG